MTREQEFRARIARISRIQKVNEYIENNTDNINDEQESNRTYIMPSIDGVKKSIVNFENRHIEER